ncbi:MAG: glycine--tRNA ligase subunit beta, partial [Acidobacteriota bacterium]
QVLPLTIAGVAAGRLTFPRRGTAQAPVRLGSASAYGQALKDLGIQGEPRLRRRDIQLRVVAEAKKAGGRAMVGPDLLGIVTNLVEIPGCFAGEYPEVFLELPPEVLTTTLKHHQRCFSVQDGGGNLLPRFVAVVNRPDDPEGLVRTGYQRVIAGRLADARFFYMEDRKQPLESRIEVLERTRLHPRLGSYAAKIRRQDQLVIDLCRWVEADETTVLHCRRAARLAKCDLATQVENEFPELQGRVGGIYAREEGEPAPVWQAIYDQYLPAGLEDQLPRGLVGSLLSVADRADLLVGLMGVGVVPKGSRDPFALRRSALGLVRILVERSLHLSVRGLLARALELFTQQKVEWQLAPDEIVDRVSGFVAGRLQFLLERRKDYRYDSIAAVMAAGGDDPADAAARLEALTEIRKQEDFLALVGAAKRIRNILKQAGSDLHQPQLGKVDEALLTETAEKDLLDATRRVRRLVTDCLKSRDHGGALRAMASLGPQVDRFFDTVLVMAGDERTRRQRLALLATIAGLYQEEADFAEIVVEGSR